MDEHDKDETMPISFQRPEDFITAALTDTDQTSVSPSPALKAHLDWLDGLIALDAGYANLPLGLNPRQHTEFKAELQALGRDLRAMAQMVKRLSSRTQRYRWDQALTKWLDQSSAPGRELSQPIRNLLIQWDWAGASPYAIDQPEDLIVRRDKVFQPMQEAIDQARQVLAKEQKRHKKKTPSDPVASALTDYFNQTERNLKTARAQLAHAMLVRLETAAQNGDLGNGDYLQGLSAQLFAYKETAAQMTRLGACPETAPQRLTPQEFAAYHQTITQYGNPVTQERLKQLPWVQSGYYQLNQKTNRWQGSPTLSLGAERIRVPRTLTRFPRLFRGKKTRYLAFQNAYHLQSLRFAEQHAVHAQQRFEKQHPASRSTQGYARLSVDFKAVQKERERIATLRQGLSVFQRSTKRALAAYEQTLRDYTETIAEAQLTALDCALLTDSSELESPKTQVQLLSLVDDLEQAIVHLPDDADSRLHPNPETQQTVSVKTLVEQKTKTFRDQLRDRQVTRLVEHLNEAVISHHPSFVEDGRLLYRKPDITGLNSAFLALTQGLRPDESDALTVIARAASANYGSEQQPLTYDELTRAAQQLAPEHPETILAPLFERFVAPSIIAVGTPGYELLAEYERWQASIMGARPRTQLLQVSAEENRVALYGVLDEMLLNLTTTGLPNTVTRDRQNPIPFTSFVKQLAQLNPSALAERLAPVINAYNGEDEVLWPLLSHAPRSQMIEYAHTRFCCLANDKDLNGIQDSPVLLAMELQLQRHPSFQKDLWSQMSDVSMTPETLANIDAIITRFGDGSIQTLWKTRRDTRITEAATRAIVGTATTQEINDWNTCLSAHLRWLASDAVQSALRRQLRVLRLKDWSSAQHSFMQTVAGDTLHGDYQLRLLKRVLSKPDFADTFGEALPTEDDILERFSLLSDPRTREVLEKALARQEALPVIEHLEPIRYLDSLLHDGWAITLGMEDLTQRCDQVIARALSDHGSKVLAKEAVSFLDLSDHDGAREKIHALRARYNYAKVCHKIQTMQTTEKTLLTILEAIEERTKLSVNNEHYVVLDDAKAYLAYFNALPSAAKVLYRLQNAEQLPTLVATFTEELAAIATGERNDLPTLARFITAYQKDEITLSSKADTAFGNTLRAALESDAFQQLQPATQKILFDLAKNFKEAIPAIPTPPEPPKPVFDFEAKTEIGRQIIADLQEDKVLSIAKALLHQVFLQYTETEREPVEIDLLQYFSMLYRITTDEENANQLLSTHAHIQIKNLKYVLIQYLQLDNQHALVFLANNHDRIANHIHALGLSLKALIEEQYFGQFLVALSGRAVKICLEINNLKLPYGRNSKSYNESNAKYKKTTT